MYKLPLLLSMYDVQSTYKRQPFKLLNMPLCLSRKYAPPKIFGQPSPATVYTSVTHCQLTFLYCFPLSPSKCLYSFQAIPANMDMTPFKLDIDELIADYATVNFFNKFMCVMYILTWMSNIRGFLIGRKTAQHLLFSSEFGRRRNFLISMKAGPRQTLVSSCSPSFCTVSVGVGFLEAQISRMN